MKLNTGVRMFNQQELQMLIGGTPGPIDLDDLRANCVYGGLYDESHEVIKMFWKVRHTFLPLSMHKIDKDRMAIRWLRA